MFNIPTFANLKAMNDEDVQKFLDTLKADEQTALASLADRETQFFAALNQLLMTNGFKIAGTIGITHVSLVVETVPNAVAAI